jgi:hypothetical protein
MALIIEMWPTEKAIDYARKGLWGRKGRKSEYA